MRTYTPEEIEQLEHDLLTAPGAKPLYDMPTSGKRLMNTKLAIADSQIKNCVWCGAHTISKGERCTWCTSHGYPTIK